MRTPIGSSLGKAGLHALLSPLLVLACGGETPTEPDPDTGQLDVSTLSIGSAIDADGYEVVLNGAGSRPIDAASSSPSLMICNFAATASNSLIGCISAATVRQCSESHRN